MTGDPAPIVIPSHLRKLYESAMSTYDEAKALETARNICDHIDDFDEDALDAMDVAEQKRRFAVDKMTDAMDVRCIKTFAVLTISSFRAGFCTGCKTPIVCEWKVV